MNPAFRSAIEDHYEIKIQQCTAGPVGQVGYATYVIVDEQGRSFFCKFINKPLFIPRIIRTLPLLREMYDKGVTRICYPIHGKDGLCIMVDSTLVVLFNYIPAQQGYDYDLYSFGQLLGQIHAITPKLTATMPIQGFKSPHQEFLETGFERLLQSQKTDAVSQKLQQVLHQYQDTTRLYIAEYLRLIEHCSQKPCAFVVTHGDVNGNVLVKSPDDFYIMDWDEMELAPAERDMWLFADKPEFMAGYKTSRPDFTLDDDHLKHAILGNYFEGLMIYLTEALNENADTDYRLKHTQKLKEKRFKRPCHPLIQYIFRG